MEYRRFVFITIVLCSVGVIAGWGSGWTRFGNSSYLVSKEAKTWAEAVSSCTAMGAELVELETEAEYYFVFRQVSLNHVPSSVWVGATDQKQEGDWRWMNGEKALQFTKWSPGEPNGGHHENCLSLSPPPNGLYNDLACSTVRPYVCEMRLNDGGNLVG